MKESIPLTKSHVIYDAIYGFIKINPVEWEIIHSPFYQRLRWIKQLGFSFYVFPGAEHSRFGHSIGVMYNAHKILQSIDLAVSTKELMDPTCLTKEALYHKSLRLAALLHDLGTFCFSHTTEMAYIKYGETTNSKKGKSLQRRLADDHENLGSYIIKNTDYRGGITHILKKYNIDPQMISDLVKGVDPSHLANQILHSEIDCDRMDYLLRDAHYTGLNYGTYDRDYLLHHFQVRNVDGHDVLSINHNAIHCVEDFLMSRFSWYSQVIRSPRGAKFDALAERLCFHFLEKGWIYRYSDLLEMVAKRPEHFYAFNDNYFMSLIHKHYCDGSLDKDPHIKDMASCLLFEKSPEVVRSMELRQTLFNQDNTTENKKTIKKAEAKILEIQKYLKKHGDQLDWLIPDLPTKDIIFVSSYKKVVQGKSGQNVLLERDPVKISYDNGDLKLLTHVENSVISKLADTKNFIPNAFCSRSAYELLSRAGLIENE